MLVSSLTIQYNDNFWPQHQYPPTTFIQDVLAVRSDYVSDDIFDLNERRHRKLIVVSSENKRKVHVPQVSLMMTVFVRRRPNKVLSFVIELDKGLKVWRQTEGGLWQILVKHKVHLFYW